MISFSPASELNGILLALHLSPGESYPADRDLKDSRPQQVTSVVETPRALNRLQFRLKGLVEAQMETLLCITTVNLILSPIPRGM